MEIPESQNSRDARIEHLWKRLDPQSKGELDFDGLKKGLIRIDHRKQSRTLLASSRNLICV
jgi:solute carrier family 25 phosphate transporter 23/24/25/41